VSSATVEQLAEIAVSARYNASLNPEAYYRTRSPSTTCRRTDDGRSADEAALLHPQ
jgi:acetyl-CoA acetyltransferase